MSKRISTFDRESKFPSRKYKKCKACGSTDLIRLEVDVLCADCDWDSTEETVASGLMDELFTASREHFINEESARLLFPNEEDRPIEIQPQNKSNQKVTA